MSPHPATYRLTQPRADRTADRRRCHGGPAELRFGEVDGGEDDAAELVVAAQQPVRYGEDFTAGIAACCGEQHRRADKDHRSVACHVDRPVVLRDEGERHEPGKGDQMREWAGRVQSAPAPPRPDPLCGEQYAGERDQAKGPQQRGEAARDLGLEHAADQVAAEQDSRGGARGPDRARAIRHAARRQTCFQSGTSRGLRRRAVLGLVC